MFDSALAIDTIRDRACVQSRIGDGDEDHGGLTIEAGFGVERHTALDLELRAFARERARHAAAGLGERWNSREACRGENERETFHRTLLDMRIREIARPMI